MTREQEEAIEFQRIVTEGLIPKMEASQVCVSLCPQSPDRVDAKFCVELGAMIMLNKPILAVIQPGGFLPPKLALVADKVVYADLATEEGRNRIMEAANEMVAQ